MRNRIRTKRRSVTVGRGPKVNRDYIRAKEAEEHDEESKLLARWTEKAEKAEKAEKEKTNKKTK